SKKFMLRAIGSQILRVNVLKERPRQQYFANIVELVIRIEIFYPLQQISCQKRKKI
ncbi:3158_t:CDS:2, partial [Funneliformis caledonium]